MQQGRLEERTLGVEDLEEAELAFPEAEGHGLESLDAGGHDLPLVRLRLVAGGTQPLQDPGKTALESDSPGGHVVPSAFELELGGPAGALVAVEDRQRHRHPANPGPTAGLLVVPRPESQSQIRDASRPFELDHLLLTIELLGQSCHLRSL